MVPILGITEPLVRGLSLSLGTQSFFAERMAVYQVGFLIPLLSLKSIRGRCSKYDLLDLDVSLCSLLQQFSIVPGIISMLFQGPPKLCLAWVMTPSLVSSPITLSFLLTELPGTLVLF